MVTLYNRATPSQRRILRIVEGAVKNVADHHPELQLTPRTARSIAKRAAGTLTAQWPDVLAAQSKPSVGAEGGTWCIARPPIPQVSRGSGRGSRRLSSPRSPLHRLRAMLVVEVGIAKRSGASERAAVIVDILKMIAALGVPK